MRTRSGGFEEFMGGAPALSARPDETPAPPPIDPLVGPRGEVPASYARIVRRVFSLDVDDTYERVTRGLQVGKSPAHRAEYGDVVDELDEASDLHLRAH